MSEWKMPEGYHQGNAMAFGMVCDRCAAYVDVLRYRLHDARCPL